MLERFQAGVKGASFSIAVIQLERRKVLIQECTSLPKAKTIGLMDDRVSPVNYTYSYNDPSPG